MGEEGRTASHHENLVAGQKVLRCSRRGCRSSRPQQPSSLTSRVADTRSPLREHAPTRVRTEFGCTPTLQQPRYRPVDRRCMHPRRMVQRRLEENPLLSRRKALPFDQCSASAPAPCRQRGMNNARTRMVSGGGQRGNLHRDRPAGISNADPFTDRIRRRRDCSQSILGGPAHPRGHQSMANRPIWGCQWPVGVKLLDSTRSHF